MIGQNTDFVIFTGRGVFRVLPAFFCIMYMYLIVLYPKVTFHNSITCMSNICYRSRAAGRRMIKDFLEVHLMDVRHDPAELWPLMLLAVYSVEPLQLEVQLRIRPRPSLCTQTCWVDYHSKAE